MIKKTSSLILILQYPVLIALTLLTNIIYGQDIGIEQYDKELLNWPNKDLENDKILGTSVDKLYDSILINMPPKKTVIVAVVDGGVDINHEDLIGKEWINPNEIPNNNIDDDNNGYIDDINGWNFIGNKDGQNINYENFEYTRIIKDKDKFPNYFWTANVMYEKELSKRKKEKENIDRFESNYNKAKQIILDITKVSVKNESDLAQIQSNHPDVINAANYLKKKYSSGFSEKILNDLKLTNEEYLNYHLNKEFNPRDLINDDLSNLDDRDYGNNNTIGPRTDHGTSVAGLIAANRNNNKGINGMALNVLIMTLRTVPNGDERDKDVALSIIYAVDNGADIINLSFGKKISPYKELVDEAIKYADDRNVLIVHGAGNYGINIDEEETYPSDRYSNGSEPSNWINVGATNRHLKKNLPAVFSDYGINHVDIFAPGADIITLDSLNAYKKRSGTSFSAPIVSGIAAILLCYFPDLKPSEIIDLLMEGSYKVVKPKKVLQPSLSSPKRKKVHFRELSKSGGVVNAYNSFLLAIERYNKKASD